MHFLSRTSISHLIFFTVCFTGESVQARRGNDFGNGGDPVREVFNAGRVFAQDLLKSVNTAALQEFGTQPDLVLAYGRYRLQLLTHLQESEHQWDNRIDLKACARVVPSNHSVIQLSYKNCPLAAPTALLAMPLLLKSSWRAVSDVRDYAIADAVTEALMDAWYQLNADAPRKAAAFSLQRPSLTGDWRCRSGNTEFQVRVRPEGLLQASWPVGIGHGKYMVQFSNFLRLNASRSNFTSIGVLLTPRAREPQRSNVVFDSKCSYHYEVELSPHARSPDLLQLSAWSNGIPDIAQGCRGFRAVRHSAICVRNDH